MILVSSSLYSSQFHIAQQFVYSNNLCIATYISNFKECIAQITMINPLHRSFFLKTTFVQLKRLIE